METHVGDDVLFDVKNRVVTSNKNHWKQTFNFQIDFAKTPLIRVFHLAIETIMVRWAQKTRALEKPPVNDKPILIRVNEMGVKKQGKTKNEKAYDQAKDLPPDEKMALIKKLEDSMK